MSNKVAEYRFGENILVVTDRGFYMYNVNEENVLVDASTILDGTGWVVEISCDPKEYEHYSEVNSLKYFSAGIGVKKNE